MRMVDNAFETGWARNVTTFALVLAYAIGILQNPSYASSSSIRVSSRNVLPLVIPTLKKADVREGMTDFADARLEFPAIDDPRIMHARVLLEGAFGEPKDNGVKIVLSISSNGLGSEGYFLKIDHEGALIKANSPSGLLYGAVTLVQMRGLARSTVLPHAEIQDAPDLSYRGLMLDMGRNYIPIAQLKEQIEIFSNYKINIFHWHLTDDPAWRFEVKSHPELTSAASMDPNYAPGAFYSQKEIRDIIDYAKARNVTVVPEIDIPGHCAALRRALGVTQMNDPKVTTVLRDSFRELLALATPNEMPLIHIGSDEVRTPQEQMPKGFIGEIARMIQRSGRQVILWGPGMHPPTEDDRTIQMLWGTGKPNLMNPYIDARALYASTYTGFDAVRTPFWNAPARDGYGKRFGAEMALWFDLPNHNSDIERIAPFWPAVLTYSDRAWHGGEFRGDLLVTRPCEWSPEGQAASAFDDAIVANRNAFFRNIMFPYIRDSGYWRLLGPFPNSGNFDQAFGPEKEAGALESSSILVESKIYGWEKTACGAQVFLKQMWKWPGALDASTPQATPWPNSQEERTKSTNSTVYARAILESDSDQEIGFWIQVDPPNPSDRRAGPNPSFGQWSRSNARIWINGMEIEPPKWKTPGLGANPVWHDPVPITDEFYYLRPSIPVELHKGDNVILLRLPDAGVKWEFVCTPVQWDGVNAREVEGVRFKKW